MTCNYIDLAMTGVRNLHPYQAGKPIEELKRELGLTRISKLASNENPLGPSPIALEAMKAAASELARYPDGNGFALKAALAAHHDIDPACITLGNGSNDVLDIIARAYLGPGREAVFSQYAFAVYPISTQAVGAESVVVPALPAGHPMAFGHDLTAMLAAITERTSVVFIANPNNPTGTWVDEAPLEAFLAAVPERVIVVLDEAYVEYVEDGQFADGRRWLSRFPNLVVTRTFSKIYGLAGLRVGFGLSHPDVANVLNRVRLPFNNNSLALVAAEAALGDRAYLAQTVAANTAALVTLRAGLVELGLSCLPSLGNFLCVDMGRIALPLYEALLAEGVIVRPVSGYGMPHHLRISTGTADEMAHCMEALRKVMARD